MATLYVIMMPKYGQKCKMIVKKNDAGQIADNIYDH